MTDWNEEAREIMGKNFLTPPKYAHVLEMDIATALADVYERGRAEERERCAAIADEVDKIYSLARKAVESVRSAK